MALSQRDFKRLAKVLEDLATVKAQNRIYELFPETGPLRRELYGPHLEFFKAGAWARERALIAANGIGKTIAGGCEITYHLTGEYPDWWQGKRFSCPVDGWACSKSFEDARDILQYRLLGRPGYEGTGLIPKSKIDNTWRRGGGLPNAIESVTVKHISGGLSHLAFKAYQQEREGFQGREKHFIWLDEECKTDIYDECLMRTRTVGGCVMVTFTPLQGLSEVVLHFMPGGKIPETQGPDIASRFVVNATWDDAPHLSEEEKREMLDGMMPYMRDARAKGIPALGSGAIYPILDEDVMFDDRWLYEEGGGNLPVWLKYANGMDVGWNHATACVFGAYDDKNDICYIYRVYKQGRAEPATHVGAIKSSGDWIPTVCDPASSASSQADGTKLIDKYNDLGLYLFKADNTVETGILEVWQRLVSGRLKIAKSCTPLFDELRTYHRDEHGKIVKLNDDLLDALRYLVLSGLPLAIEPPYDEAYPDEADYYHSAQSGGVQGRSAWTGY